MSVSLSTWFDARFFKTGNNAPLTGGKIYTYLAGTTTPAVTYSNDSGATNTNPIILDADGRANIYLDDAVSYRFILKDANNVTQKDVDNIRSSRVDIVQKAATIADLRLLTGTSANSNAVATLGYYVAGDGGGNTFYWDSASGATDNGGTVIKPTSVTGTGRWIALNTLTLNPRQFGAKGDGLTDDTNAIANCIAQSTSSVVFDAGIYVTGKITINKKVFFKGTKGTKSGANVFPRLLLKSATNDNLINVTTSGVLYADCIDFHGNKSAQTVGATANCISLDEQSGAYVGANAIFLNDCIIRQSAASGIYCNKNRNGGRLLNTLILDCDNAGFVLFGSDWYCNFSEFGLSGGANLYTDFGASNDFVLCDFYYSGQNALYGSSKSNIYVGTAVNALTISSCQINSAYHHGIECAVSIASAHYIFTSNQFGNNGLAAVNTYSNIVIGNSSAVIESNTHWDFGQKPKYLIETVGGINKVWFGDNYKSGSYVTAVTNDTTKLHIKNINGFMIGDSGFYDVRKSANDKVMRCYTGSDANPKFSIDLNGIIRWGAGGGSAEDVALLRVNANVLEVATDDCLRTGRNTTASRPSAGAVGIGSQFFDTTLSKPIWSDGTNWRDAAGTIV